LAGLLLPGPNMVPEILTWGRTGFADELFFGALNTLTIALASYFFGLALGQIGAIAKLYGGPAAKAAAGFYTTFVRSIPELVLVLLLYFIGTRGISSVSQALGFGPVEVNGLVAAIVVLSVVQGAYATEVIRGAIQAIPVGQIEAAKAYGMSGPQMLRRVIIPAMLPNALPGLANLWLALLKETVLISVTGASPELAQAAKNAAGYSKRYFLFYFAAGAIFLIMTLMSNRLFAFIETRLRRGQQQLA
jgi:polar amino acid transport system permease protein